MEKNPSGFFRRMFADFLDVMLLTIPVTVVLFLISGEYSYDWSTGWTWRIIYTAYLTIVPLLWSGYIIGKRILKIRVKRVDEQSLTLKDMILREVVGKSLLGNLTFGVSILISVFMIIFRKDKRAIHDLIAGTYVSRD